MQYASAWIDVHVVLIRNLSQSLTHICNTTCVHLTQNDEIRIDLYFDYFCTYLYVLEIQLKMIKCCEVLGFHDAYSDEGDNPVELRWDVFLLKNFMVLEVILITIITNKRQNSVPTKDVVFKFVGLRTNLCFEKMRFLYYLPPDIFIIWLA